MLLSIPEFIGHFHPLLVHLPIGILLTGLFLQWLSRKEKYKNLQEAVPVVLFVRSDCSRIILHYGIYVIHHMTITIKQLWTGISGWASRGSPVIVIIPENQESPARC